MKEKEEKPEEEKTVTCEECGAIIYKRERCSCKNKNEDKQKPIWK